MLVQTGHGLKRDRGTENYTFYETVYAILISPIGNFRFRKLWVRVTELSRPVGIFIPFTISFVLIIRCYFNLRRTNLGQTEVTALSQCACVVISH